MSASPEIYANDMSTGDGQAEEGDKKETHELPDGALGTLYNWFY